MLDTENPKEKALLVGVNLRRSEDLLSLEDSLQELELLADTAGVEVVGLKPRTLIPPIPKHSSARAKWKKSKSWPVSLTRIWSFLTMNFLLATSVNWRTLLESRYG